MALAFYTLHTYESTLAKKSLQGIQIYNIARLHFNLLSVNYPPTSCKHLMCTGYKNSMTDKKLGCAAIYFWMYLQVCVSVTGGCYTLSVWLLFVCVCVCVREELWLEWLWHLYATLNVCLCLCVYASLRTSMLFSTQNFYNNLRYKFEIVMRTH